MRIAIVGTGFVGLTHAAACAEAGHHVVAYDVDAAKIAAYQSGEAGRIERHVNEPGLSACIARCHRRTLFFTTEPGELVQGVEAVFLCVPTPARHDGATDRGHHRRAAHQVAALLRARQGDPRRTVVVNKSTVPIGTARATEAILREHGVHDVGVVSNPEFLPQGQALERARHPDRVVLGARQPRDFAILGRVYRRFVDPARARYLETTPETAEAIKYVANALLFTYISFWNGIGARLAETHPDLRIDDLRLGVTADARISPWGAQVGVGAGGSCLGKDIRSLIHQIERQGHATELLRAVYRINQHQKTYLIERAGLEAGFSFNNKTVALLGLAFKKDTNDMRDSAALRAVEALLARGVRHIRAYDPLAAEQARSRWFHPARNHLYERISYHATPREALRGSHALYIATDLEEFRELSPVIRDAVTPPYLVIDGRRILGDYASLQEAGIQCLTVGAALHRSTRPGDRAAQVVPISDEAGPLAASARR